MLYPYFPRELIDAYTPVSLGFFANRKAVSVDEGRFNTLKRFAKSWLVVYVTFNERDVGQ